MTNPCKNIDFAISYAGEDIFHVKEISTRLRQFGFSVFLAAEQRGLIVGLDGEYFFDQLFSTASQVLVFISEAYKRKEWPRYEWDVIRSRDKQKRFFPIRVDDARILGLPSNILYLDIRRLSYDEIASSAIKQLLLYEQENYLKRPSEFEVILDAIRNDSKGALSKGYQLVVDKRERTPLDNIEIPNAEWIPSYIIVETEWCDFSKVRRLSGKICVPEGMKRDELIFNLKHCAASLFNELKPDALMIFAYSGEPCYSKEWGIYNEGRIIYAPHGRWENAMDGVAYNLPVSEFEYRIDFPSINTVDISNRNVEHTSIRKTNNMCSKAQWIAPLKSIFKDNIEIHGNNYSLDEIPSMPQDITRFMIKAGPTNIGFGSAFVIEGSVRIQPIQKPFKVVDGVHGRKYMIFLQGYLISPQGSIVWRQQGFPRGSAWVNYKGGVIKFHLINSYEGKTKGYRVIIIAVGDPIVSESDQTRVLLGMKEIILN